MNPLKNIFVQILLLLAGINNSYASRLEYKANQAFIDSILWVEFSHQSSEKIEPGSLLAVKFPRTVIDSIDQFTSPCDQILEAEVLASPPGSLPEKVLCKLATDLANFPELRKLFDSAENVGGRFVKAWEKWIDFPNLRTRIDLLKNYYPQRSKIILDIEETFDGCHSKARHGSHLTSNDMQLRAKDEHPTLPGAKTSTKFDSEQLHDDAVNAAYNQHKDAIEAHFANGGGYKEWDIDYGIQVGSGYYNSGDYGPGAILNEVTTKKVKIAFDKDLTNPTGYKMISAYPWYKP